MLALEYDQNGNKVRQIDVTGKLTAFEYDRQGQLLRLTDDGQELAAYAYNPDGTPRAVTHGPIRQEYAYDLDKNLTGLTVRSGDTLLSQVGYAYDGNGNETKYLLDEWGRITTMGNYGVLLVRYFIQGRSGSDGTCYISKRQSRQELCKGRNDPLSVKIPP